MIQLLCSGVQLDLEQDIEIQLKKSNPLFAFDDLSCERTTEFNIPATPKNDKVFELAKDPAFKGNGMRRKLSAQLVNGTIVKNGYLHVDSYKEGKYSAVFVFGELTKLKDIKDAGDVADYVTDRLLTVGSPVSAASDLKNDAFDAVQYHWSSEEQNFPAPSVSLPWLCQQLAAYFGVAMSIPQEVDQVRIVAPVGEPMKSEKITITNTCHNVLPVKNDDPQYDSNTMTSGCTLLEPTTYDVARYAAVKNTTLHCVSDTFSYRLGVLYARQNITITFPDDFPERVFLVRIISGDPEDYRVSGNIQFLGDYSLAWTNAMGNDTFDMDTGECTTEDNEKYKYSTGNPLAGRSVEIAAGSIITFLTPYDLCSCSWSGYFKKDWVFKMASYSYKNITVKGTDDAVDTKDYQVRLKDNLPDVSFVDLLKTISNISGKALYYSDAAGISFDVLDFASWPVVDITKKLVKIDEVKRGEFNDYKQKNFVTYSDDDDLVSDADRQKLYYTVDNDNLDEKEDELYTVPFSPASKYDATDAALVDNNKEAAEEYMLMKTNGTDGDAYMHRVPLVKIEPIQDLCDSSIKLECEASMSQLEYEQVTDKTCVLVRGTLYVWLESTFSAGTAKFTLAKI